MKKIIFVFFITSISLAADAQWIQQNSGTNQNLYDIEFINEKTGWAVGDAGIVIKTTNGGRDWLNIPNPSPSISPNLWSVEPIDSDIVYVTSSGDFLMKTTNGGNNWNVLHQCVGCNSSFIGIHFLNKDTGWVLGSYKVFRTFDGGNTLDSLYAPWFTNYEIYFKDLNTGIFCGDGRVFKTTDGGMNWHNTNVSPGTFYQFRKLAVINDNVWLIASGDAPVFHSSNFCDSWTILDTIYCYPPSVMFSVAFANEMTGWTGGTYGWLYKTTNGGWDWRRENTGSDVSFWASIHCFNDSIVWGAGGAGKMYNTTTGGQTLVNINYQNNSMVYDYILHQNFPNPFNSSTKINYELKIESYVVLTVYDITGKTLSILNEGKKLPGVHEIYFDAGNLPSGIYYYKIKAGTSGEAGSFAAVKKMILIK